MIVNDLLDADTAHSRDWFYLPGLQTDLLKACCLVEMCFSLTLCTSSSVFYIGGW
jgi:hypothetical protein